VTKPKHASTTSDCSMKKNEQKIIMKRQNDYPWLVPTDGGALCQVCVDFYRDHTLPADHTGVFVTM